MPVLTNDVANAWREIEHTSLRKRALHETRHVRYGVSDGLKPARYPESIEEARDRLKEVCANVRVRDTHDAWVGNLDAGEDGERFAMPVW